MTPKLSIIIVSYNTRKILYNCLQSIYHADWKDDYEIIVVDNNSTDGSVNMIQKDFPNVKLIANSQNRYFSIANNQGAAIARGKYLLLLNSDTIVSGTNLQKLIDFAETQSNEVICIGPKILNPDGSLQSRGFSRWGSILQHFCVEFCLDKILPLHYFIPTLDVRPDKMHEAGWVAGCCMLIPREKFLEIGGLNENMVFYGEEPEFGYRSFNKGYRTLYYPKAEIIHLGGASTDKTEGPEVDFNKDIERYDSLVAQTIGYKKVIVWNKISLYSLYLKKRFYKDKAFVRARIDHERKVIKYFKNKLNS